MLAALTHDFGKSVCTMRTEKDGVRRWTSRGHAQAGVPMSQQFLSSFEGGEAFLHVVPNLVRDHMAHCEKHPWSPKAIRRLAERLNPCTIEQLVLLMEADCNGRPPLPKGLPQNVGNLIRGAKHLGIYG